MVKLIREKSNGCDVSMVSSKVLEEEACARTSYSYKDYMGIWVFCEQRNDEAIDVAYELLGEGKRLASQLEVKLSAVIFGKNIEKAAEELIAYGADVVYLVEHDLLEYFNDQIYTEVLENLVKEYRPEILLIGSTTYGRSIAPRVASRLDTGLTADCTQLDVNVEEKLLLQTRPAFGGDLMATIKCSKRRPQMATVRPRTMEALKADYLRRGEIIKHTISINGELKTKIIDVINNIETTSNLLDADIIVGVGKGIGNINNMNLIKEMAKTLGASIGASRGVVDLGWIGYEHQIGQTGKTVKPKIYFACGISGAIQHLAGISSSEYIIAINNDPHAPIFKVANIGIVGDLKQIIPAIITEIKGQNVIMKV